MRRALITIAASLILISLDFYPADIPRPWPSTRNVEAEPSGATMVAPANATFDAEPDAAARNSPLGRSGTIEPPGWRLAKGGARPEKGGPSDAFALLHDDDATLVSSPFTLSPTTRKFSFRFKFFAPGARGSRLRVFLLSGAAFDSETEVFARSSKSETDWDKAWIDVSKWSGQTIEFKVVRPKDSDGAVGIDDVAADLLEAKIGRNRKSAHVADPVNTTNGNFRIANTDISIPGKGVPLEFTRYFNSDSTFNGTLGNKWTNTYSLGITPEGDGSATVRYADGHAANFAPNVPLVDAVSTASQNLSWSHTTTDAGGNLILLVGLYFQAYTEAAVTYGGYDLTELSRVSDCNQVYYWIEDSCGGARAVEVWYLLNPPTGTHTLSVSFDYGPYQRQAVAITFSNAAQAAPTASSAAGFGYGDPSPNVSISVPGSPATLVADFVGVPNNGSSIPDSSQTQMASFVLGTQALGASTKPGVYSSTSMGWTKQGAATESFSLFGQTAVRLDGASSPQFLAPPGNFDTLVRNSDGTFKLTTTTQIAHNFDSSGQLTSTVDRNGNTTTVAYSSGRVSTVTDPGGRTLTLAYNGSGKLTTITDPMSRSVQFSVNGSGDLASVTDQASQTTSYTYDGSHRLLYSLDPLSHKPFENIFDSANRVVEQKDGVNGVTCMYYGTAPSYASANCSGVTPPASSGQTVVVDPRGNKTTYGFDTSFRTYQIKDAQNGVVSYTYDSQDNTLCVSDQLGKKTALSYDTKGNVTQVIDPLNTTSSCGLISGGVKTLLTYTPKNDLDLLTNPLGRQVSFSYDALGNPSTLLFKDGGGATKAMGCFTVNAGGLPIEVTKSTTLTDCTGNKAKGEYDSYGNLTAAIDPRFSGQQTPPKDTLAYNGDSLVTSVTNELGHTTTYTYDAAGRVLTVTNALSQVTTNTYDAAGNLKTVTDALGKVTTFNYDNADRLTSVVDAANGTTSYAYDANGNRTSVTNPRGKVTTYAYDALNRVTSTTNPNNRTASLQYDAHSRVTQRTDARGLVTKYFYDAASRLTRAEHWNGSTFVDQVTYGYDALNNRTQMVDPTGTTAYAYDALNRATSITFPANKVVSYQYDNAGRRTRVTYPDGKTVDYGYDAASNLTSVTDWSSRLTTYAYDNAGNLTATTLPSASGLNVTRTYDNAERLTQVTNLGTWRSMIVTAHDFSSSATWTPPTGMTEAFDAASKAVPNSGGISIEGDYALQGQAGATGVKTATASDYGDFGNAQILALRPSSAAGVAFRSASSAGADDSVLSLTINKPAGTAQNDVMIASISVRPSSASITPPSGWTLVRRTDNTNSPTNSLAVYRKVAGASEPSSYAWTFSTSSGSAGGIQSFSGVDTANPISAESGQTTALGLSHATPSIDVPASGSTISSFTYTLNAAGARTQVVDGSGTTTYAYDNLYRLTSVTYPGPTTDSYSYDANGNRLTKNATAYAYDNADQMTAAGGVSYGYDNNGNQTSRGSDTFAWDFENRMTSATVGGTATTYTYNGDGLRLSRASGGVTSSYVWDVNRGLPVILQDTTGSATTTYVYGLGMLYWVDGSGNPTYRLTDGLGSTANLCDASGNVTDTWTYDVFGAVRSHTGTNGTEFTFTGEQNDPNGLEYLRARYYDPASGRFLGRDPLGGGYPYAGGNPLNRIDPSGLYPICFPVGSPDGEGCYDSTEVGLPPVPPVFCSDGTCYWHGGFTSPYEGVPAHAYCSSYSGGSCELWTADPAKSCGPDLNCDGKLSLDEIKKFCGANPSLCSQGGGLRDVVHDILYCGLCHKVAETAGAGGLCFAGAKEATGDARLALAAAAACAAAAFFIPGFETPVFGP